MSLTRSQRAKALKRIKHKNKILTHSLEKQDRVIEKLQESLTEQNKLLEYCRRNLKQAKEACVKPVLACTDCNGTGMLGPLDFHSTIDQPSFYDWCKPCLGTGYSMDYKFLEYYMVKEYTTEAYKQRQADRFLK